MTAVEADTANTATDVNQTAKGKYPALIQWMVKWQTKMVCQTGKYQMPVSPEDEDEEVEGCR